MKLIAAFFLITFSAFTCEQVVVPLSCFNSKPGSGAECMKGRCMKGKCMKAMSMGKMKEKPSKKTSPSSKCDDCPLCVTMVTPATIFLSSRPLKKMQYAAIEISPHSEYRTAQWKPPNGVFLS